MIIVQTWGSCFFMKTREGAFLISVGSDFQYFGAETENDLSYKMDCCGYREY